MRKTRIFLACLLIMMLFTFVGCGNDDGALDSGGDVTDAGQDNAGGSPNDDAAGDGAANDMNDVVDNMTTSGGGTDNNQNTDANNN